MRHRTPLRSGNSMLLLFLTVILLAYQPLSAQNNEDDYAKEWLKVEAFTSKSLPRSALEIVEQIYAKARNENNQPEQVKAVLFKIELSGQIEENSDENAINLVVNEIKTTSFPATSIYHSILAELYWNYYANHRYQWLKRTTTQSTESEDIKTWDLQKLIAKVIQHHLEALKNAAELKNIPRENYKVLLQEDLFSNDQERQDAVKARPTLYDFLAHRAIDRFMHNETTLSHPADQFLIDDPSYLSSYQVFSKLKLSTGDTLSLPFYALRLLQDLIDFHKTDKDPAALIDVDLKRLEFIYNTAVFEEKDLLYQRSLKALQDEFVNDPASADIAYKRALYFNTSANLYKPLVSNEHKNDLINAVAICEDINNKFPKSAGAENCRILLKQIQELSLSLIMDDVVVPGKPVLGLLSYKNIGTYWWRIVPIVPSRDKEIRQSGDSKKMLKEYLSMSPSNAGSLELPVDGDYNTHQVQIPLPALPSGYYVILLSPQQDFNFDEVAVSYTSFWSSNLSYINRKNSAGDYEVYVLDRQSGQAMKGVNVEGWTSDYDYKSRTRKDKLWQSFLSNNEGYVRIANPGENISRSFYLIFRNGKDQLASDDYFYLSNYTGRHNETKEQTFLFTDRAIYRPGQTIYYKGIALTGKGNDLQVRPNYKTQVTFCDVNGKEIAKTSLITNDFGSFSGTFTAPTGTLTGNMRISNEYGSVQIQVEEYKRPRFEAKFLPLEMEYKLNESITVTGKADTYAGNPVDGASVSYRVVRTASFPYWFDYRGIMPSSAQMEITNGKAVTNGKGEFLVTFKSIPDLKVPKSASPVFHYEVYADVTDQNGELRSANTSVSVGYASFILTTNLPDELNADKNKQFNLSAKNLSGKDVAVKGEVRIVQLKQPNRLYRPRKLPRPDKFIIKEDEFRKTYPLDVFDNEDDKKTWVETTVRVNKNFSMPADSVIKLEDIKNWSPGDYSIVISSIDKSGDTIRYKKFFTLYAETKKKIPGNVMNWFSLPEEPAEPGSTVTACIGSAAREVHVLFELLKDNEVVSRKWLNINNEMIKFPIPVLEDYRGNIGVSYTFVKNNRYYQGMKVLKVPFTNKELDISFETFRDKLQPGQQEEWRMKITGKMKEKVAAELLLSMYDASLDAFIPHTWPFELYNLNNYFLPWRCADVFSLKYSTQSYFHNKPQKESYYFRKYDRLINDDGRGGEIYFSVEGLSTAKGERVMTNSMAQPASASDETLALKTKSVEADVSQVPLDNQVSNEKTEVQLSPPRTNLNETAFFFPDLKTNENGDIIVKFTLPESLTRWKVMGLAHTKELRTGSVTRELLAQKDLMVFPNPPRFFREGDKMTFSTKISSLSKTDLTGEVSLELFDAITMKRIDNELYTDVSHNITLPAGGSTNTDWTFTVPFKYQAVTWRVKATAGSFSDGEESTLPVLTNRTLVTEALSLPVRGKGKFTFELEKLLSQGIKPSASLVNHQLSLEFTSNPAWYAIQALPYLMEFPYECSEQVFNRFYANQIASHIANSDPVIRKVFETWSKYTPSALLSNLEKNQDLKSVVLEETPWVMQAKSESERKQRVSLLFDLNRMAGEATSAIAKLSLLQTPNGGWPWFAGMPDDRYITGYILCGYGHMMRLNIYKNIDRSQTWPMISKAISYSDQKIREEYSEILRYNAKSLQDNHLNYNNIQYLYARSFYLGDQEIESESKEAFDYFKGQAKKYWTTQGPYMQGMIALALNRMGDIRTPKEILRSLKERALHNPELGMYWKDITSGYYWHQQGIATQALLIEAFDEISNDSVSVEDMKVWLLKQKQTNDWKTTTATADACYALLLRGTGLLTNTAAPVISVGNVVLDPDNDPEIRTEAGTGYFRTNWYGKDIQPSMAKVMVDKKDIGLSWGALYWQYFEDLDKISTAQGPVKIQRQLFIKRNTAAGPVLEKVSTENPVHLGDKVVVRITLISDRDLEYVHLKDLRAAGLEPVSVLSGYQYQEGLGYYESTRDAATHFFFSHLPKGTRIFEYTLNASQKGEFSQGITNVECMYAPEFTAHSEGIKIKIE